MKRIIFFAIVLSNAIALASAQVPESWYVLPENQKSQNLNLYADTSSQKLSEEQKIHELEKTVDNIFSANQNAIETSHLGEQTVGQKSSDKPKDWVPWRAELFTTELALTAGGMIGVLSAKGTATVRAFWRKQHAKPVEKIIDEQLDNEGLVTFSEDSSDQQIAQQIDSVVNIAVRANKVKDTDVLRSELLAAAYDFQNLSNSIAQTDQSLPWWVQRFRLDLLVDGQGHVHPNVTVGGEIRFRFEWHRIKRKASGGTVSHKTFPGKILDQSALNTFVKNMAEDLEASFGNINGHGFKAHTMRMGIGVSVKGTIGVIKGGAGAIGQIYFTRDVKKPTVNPKPQKPNFTEDQDVAIIERQPSDQNLLFAQNNHIPFAVNSLADGHNLMGIREVVYKVSRRNFRKGLEKAAKIAEFFTERAAKKNGEGWRIYELRTAFDASVGGELSMASLVGTVTAQVNFFNQNF